MDDSLFNTKCNLVTFNMVILNIKAVLSIVVCGFLLIVGGRSFDYSATVRQGIRVCVSNTTLLCLDILIYLKYYFFKICNSIANIFDILS